MWREGSDTALSKYSPPPPSPCDTEIDTGMAMEGWARGGRDVRRSEVDSTSSLTVSASSPQESTASEAWDAGPLLVHVVETLLSLMGASNVITCISSLGGWG